MAISETNIFHQGVHQL